jgi:hypothetical protein
MSLSTTEKGTFVLLSNELFIRSSGFHLISTKTKASGVILFLALHVFQQFVVKPEDERLYE